MTHAVPLTRLVADFVVGTDVRTQSDYALHMAERALVDTVGGALAAREDESVHAIWSALAGRLPSGVATVWDRSARTQARDAALINGVAAHALDYDDVVDDLIAHPSAVLVPTALAVAEETGASGRALLDAYCVGYQVECALGAGLSVQRHYSKGWHSTATVGVLGATAVAARLYRLNTRQVASALAIAASMAAGSRRNFGSMTKPLHAGLAASNGVLASVLASADFTGAADQLESPGGYFALFGDGDDVDLGAARDQLEGPWLLAGGNLNVKRYACCYYAHRAAGAALQLTQQAIDERDIARVSVTVQPGGLRPLIHTNPTDGRQAKFSLEYIVAACLHDGRLTLASFEDAAVWRPEIQALRARVCVQENARPPIGPIDWEQGYAVVQVTTHGHRIYEARLDLPPGHARAPLSETELDDKFRDCLSFGGFDAPEGLYRRLRSARDEPDARNLMQLTSAR